MSHISRLAKNKRNLELRFLVLKLIREFFNRQGFIEADAPLIVKLPDQEPNLSPMKIKVHNERGEEFKGYLHTSPEYAMKKMLAVGFDKIFYLGKCFRDYESFGGLHNPEFTMLEWYRAGVDFYKIMEDVENLVNSVLQSLKNNYQLPMPTGRQAITNFQTNSKFKFQKIQMRELWKRFVEVNLDDYLNKEKMLELCRRLGFNPEEDESYEELFYRIFLNKIEPKLKNLGAVIVYHYPAKMAALARLSPIDKRYAERFEVYVDGLELANAFSELTDADEQRLRLKAEQAERKRLGKDVYEIDEEFIEAVKIIPESAGIALGVDRLLMVLTGCENIEDVITLPTAKLFL